MQAAAIAEGTSADAAAFLADFTPDDLRVLCEDSTCEDDGAGASALSLLAGKQARLDPFCIAVVPTSSRLAQELFESSDDGSESSSDDGSLSGDDVHMAVETRIAEGSAAAAAEHQAPPVRFIAPGPRRSARQALRAMSAFHAAVADVSDSESEIDVTGPEAAPPGGAAPPGAKGRGPRVV